MSSLILKIWESPHSPYILLVIAVVLLVIVGIWGGSLELDRSN